MKTYLIKSCHDIFADYYDQGEGEHINGYTLSSELQANSAVEAVNTYLQNNLGYNLDFNNCEVSNEYPNLVQTSCLVDEDNTQPDNHELALWKAGAYDLYANHIDLFVFELKEVVF